MAIRKTALLLDDELVAQAKEIMGTKTTTETVSEALREVLRAQARLRHFERLQQLAPDLLEIERIEKEAERSVREWFGDDGDAPR